MNKKQIIRKLKATNKITFMCTFCFSYLQVTKNHFCDEALEVDGAIHPKMKEMLRKDYQKKQRLGL
ncbi:MAG: hypothetical protein CMM04_16775 [Rhodopirellula sp.]|nr:hypothetical protein [Rhodopirellula sp.]|tara:strand:+ start:1765 stop:1962 length:198 start_codon:yes stop_codon:yes gene_type:complete